MDRVNGISASKTGGLVLAGFRGGDA